MPKIEISNTKIVKFYEKHPHINIESINLIFIDLLDKLLHNVGENMNLHDEILSAVQENTHNISDLKHSFLSLKETVSSTNSDNYSKILNQLIELKRDYVEDVKNIVQVNTFDKIAPLIDKSNSTLVDKTTLILNDVIPKSQTIFYSQISDIIHSFQKSITEDSKNPSINSMKEFVNNFEIKSSLMLQNLQQPIYSYISASEDRITNSINSLKDGNSNTLLNNQTIINELADILSEVRKKDSVSHMPTNQMSGVLTKLYNTAEISVQNPVGPPGIILMKRIRKTNILVQSKDIDENVGTEDINHFMNLIEEHNCNGIFVSQKSGIATKKNYHLEVHNNNVIVFIHNCEYSPSKMELAISNIDNLSAKLRQYQGKTGDDCSIPKDVLDTINNEYQLFISQKTAIIDVFKESQRKVLAQIDELRFPSLDKFLSTKYCAPIQKPGLKCDLCKSFSANNLKALAAHKRGCVRKLTVSPITTINNIAITA